MYLLKASELQMLFTSYPFTTDGSFLVNQTAKTPTYEL
jgi:hypothetical protein